MNIIKYFLKIGKKTYLEEFANGILYCSDAETFWGIEDKLKIKGQGDILEAGSRIFAQNVMMQAHDSGDITTINMKSNVLVHIEPAKHIPVFCLFSVYEEDCELDETGQYFIALSPEKQKTIKEHFPKADSIAIIKNPEQFLENVINSIGCAVKHEEVHYFHIDKGLEIEGSEQTAMDTQYMLYLMQDVPPIIENGAKRYVFLADYAFRALFCKDVFFKDEQEYRIVLPDKRISGSERFPVEISEKIEIVPLEKYVK